MRYWNASRLPMRNWNKEDPGMTPSQIAELPDYLWGIETAFQQNHRAWFYTLPDYLWGIETNESWGIGGAAARASRLPMRNWNKWANMAFVFVLLPDYLWGIETFVVEPTPDYPLFVLPDYLWGIETWSIHGGSSSPGPCFQTTYEELKLHGLTSIISFEFQASRLPMRNWNAGWKRYWRHWKLASRLPMRNWNWENRRAQRKSVRFQTTYEELKREPASCGTGSVGASRLPMRNWNRIHRERSPRKNASRLPMRNWNWDLARASLQWMRFQTTYEELKRLPKPPFSAAVLRLPDYLWGIETWRRLCRRWLKRASRLPMRNWNATRPRSVLFRFRFQTTYEELKLYTFHFWSLALNTASRLPMRNWNRISPFHHLKNEASRLPMRNWNQRVRLRPSTRERASRLPMRNWNRIRIGRLLLCGTLPDYLWGIETRLVWKD